jgi:hypothetical protein
MICFNLNNINRFENLEFALQIFHGDRASLCPPRPLNLRRFTNVEVTRCYIKHERHPSLGIVFDTLASCILYWSKRKHQHPLSRMLSSLNLMT